MELEGRKDEVANRIGSKKEGLGEGQGLHQQEEQAEGGPEGIEQ